MTPINDIREEEPIFNWEPVINEMKEAIKQLDNRVKSNVMDIGKLRKFEVMIKNLDIKMNDIASYKDPVIRDHQIKELQNTVEDIRPMVKILANQMRKIKENKFIEIVTDREIQSLYSQSGVLQKNVASKFDISLEQASRYCNGFVKDLMIRHKLKQFFLESIEKNLG